MMITKLSILVLGLSACAYEDRLGNREPHSEAPDGSGPDVAPPNPPVSLLWDGTELLAGGLSSPAGLAVDSAQLYWNDLDHALLLAMPRAGGAITTVAPGKSQLLSFSTTMIAADDDGLAYAADDGVWLTGPGGSNPSRVLTGTFDYLVLTPAYVYALGGRRFYMDHVDRSHLDRIRRSDGTPTTLVIPCETCDLRGLAGDATYAYYVTSDPPHHDPLGSQYLGRVPLAGGPPQVVGHDLSLSGWGPIAVDSTYVYINGDRPLSLGRIPAVGGVHAPVYTATWDDTAPTAILVDGGFVYWAGFVADRNPTVSEVVCLPLAGGPAQVVGRGAGYVSGVAIDADHVYLAILNTAPDTGAIRRAPKCTAAP